MIVRLKKSILAKKPILKLVDKNYKAPEKIVVTKNSDAVVNFIL
jgi:hypothetical protein